MKEALEHIVNCVLNLSKTVSSRKLLENADNLRGRGGGSKIDIFSNGSGFC